MYDLFEMSIPQPTLKNNHEESELAMEEPSAHVYGVERAGDIINRLQFDSRCQLRYASQTGKVQLMDGLVILLSMDSLVLMINLSAGQ